METPKQAEAPQHVDTEPVWLPVPVRPQARQTYRIAMIAPPWIPVPPPGYGGIEEVVALLCDALVERGHDVELFCAPGSGTKALVRPLLSAAHPDRIERALYEADHTARAFEGIDEAAAAENPFDVVHDHSGYTALAFADSLNVPLIHTVHGPFDDDTTPYYDHHGHKGRIVCISGTQSRMAPQGARTSAVVFNPIDYDSWPVGYQKEDYLFWIGRFVAEKGPQRAIRVAKATGRRLILAGVVQHGQEEFFANEIQPHLDGGQISYVGEVGGARKQYLFAQASAFLMPITWPEPFGMVMVESLAAGTPVLAFPHGAAPEIVEHGTSGFLVRDESEMAEMVPRAGGLSPEACRRSAARFAPHTVAAGYEAVYRVAIENSAESLRHAAQPSG
jgi:glycosyltransferase involved in cell wall biosynthesis